MMIQYLKNISVPVNGKLVVNQHINSAIELMYQIHRHKLDIAHH